jgi:osmotically-inducible protein OsmY
MEPTSSRPDQDLQNAVEQALRLVLGHRPSPIGVSADRGAVTLSGEVASDRERAAARIAAMDQWGVRSVADNITLRAGH